jgi:hypothetical protein
LPKGQVFHRARAKGEFRLGSRNQGERDLLYGIYIFLSAGFYAERPRSISNLYAMAAISSSMSAPKTVLNDQQNHAGAWWDVSETPFRPEECHAPDSDQILFEMGLTIGIPLLAAFLLEFAARLGAMG